MNQDCELNTEQLKSLAAALQMAGAPEMIGCYRIIDELGEGGMGVVYLAEQAKPRRRVALKVIRPACINLSLLKRFSLEAEILGRLQHPGIAQIFEAGTAETAAGTGPFFAMEFVEGLPLTTFVREQKLSIRDRLQLLIKIAEGVQYAHQKGIIHRDLKPENILVTSDGQPKILDFGVARVTDSDLQVTTMDSDVGKLIGTLHYMSPEQAGGNPADIDTRSDVYAMGVIAFELLAGSRPYNLQNKMIHEAVRIIQQDEPSRLSTINKSLRGDIETIVSKAIEKVKESRYQSIADFASDFHHYLNNHPILARPQSSAYQFSKFARRNKVLVGAGAAIFLLLVLGIIGTAIGLVQARKAQESEHAALQNAIKQTQIAQSEKAHATIEFTNAQLQLAKERVARGDALLNGERVTAARRAYEDAWSLFEKLGVSTFPAELGVWDCDRRSSVPLFSFPDHGGLYGIAFSPSGKTALTCGQTVTLWDLTTGREIRSFLGHTDWVCSVKFSPNGLTAITGSSDKTMRLWDVESGKELFVFHGHTATVRSVAFSPNGHSALSVSDDQSIKLWNLDSREEVLTINDQQSNPGAHIVEFSPDGLRAISSGNNSKLNVWDLKTGRELRAFNVNGGGNNFAVSPDGRNVLYGEGSTLRLLDLTTGDQRYFFGHTNFIECVAYAPDGLTAISGGADNTLRQWDLATGKEMHLFIDHTQSVSNLAISPDGRKALSCGEVKDTVLRLWDLTGGKNVRNIKTDGDVFFCAAFSPDGRMVLSGGGQGSVKLWDEATCKEISTFASPTKAVGEWVRQVAFSRDGRIALSCGSDHWITVWDVASGKKIRTLIGHTNYVNSVAFGPNDRTVVSGSDDQTIKVWDVENGQVLHTLQETEQVTSVAYSPDGKAVISGGVYGTVRIWDLASGKDLHKLTRPDDSGLCYLGRVACTSDGRSVLSTNGGQTVDFWDANTGKEIHKLLGHSGCVTSLALSPNGAVAVTKARDETFRIWDLNSGEEIRAIKNGGDYSEIAFSPDGRTVLSQTYDAISLWDFSRPMRASQLELSVGAAEAALVTNPDNPPALAVIGEWCAFQGANDLAITHLEKARALGTDISALTLARCYWELGRLPEAEREFQRALERKEAPDNYLRLCLHAVHQARYPAKPAIP